MFSFVMFFLGFYMESDVKGRIVCWCSFLINFRKWGSDRNFINRYEMFSVVNDFFLVLFVNWVMKNKELKVVFIYLEVKE